MMRNDSLFIGLVARISLGGFVFTCHKEERAQNMDLFSFFSRLSHSRGGHVSRRSDAMQLLPWP